MPKTPVIVFGSGGLAKEIIGYLAEAENIELLYVVSTEQFKGNAYDKIKVFPVVHELLEGTQFILAVADPQVKRKIVSQNEDRWASYIHPTATVSKYATIGRGCIIAPQAIVVGDCVLGDFVFLNTNATAAHDCVIGDYTTLFPNAEICGDCTVGEDAIFGIGSYVLPGKRISAGAKISAGAIVRQDILDTITVYGDPAKPRALRVA